ncbi:MAG TPA: pyruvate kinase [Lachnospiraceae bacterium]|nr:pyruvate kinase [Lachnospiraceae bacterium]
MKKTKIVCTLGPASQKEEVLRQMIEKGMNVARLNFSHGTHEYHKENIDLIKRLRDEMNVSLAILLDTKGPEIRTKDFAEGKVVLEEGSEFTLTTREVEGTNQIVSITYQELPKEVEAGNTILIDDGSINLLVKSTTDTDIVCEVIVGGDVSNHKGINVPCVHLNMPYMSEADKADVKFGVEQGVEFIAASFVRCKEDIMELRKFVDYYGGQDIRLISKIENVEGIDNFDEILKHSDGIMVARGDMGVEVEFERLPGLQKRFIKKCYQSGKMVITATQMLESMIQHPHPTRAEITDVANAVFDGTSAVMLSGETAMGQYPVLAVEVMAKVARQAEHDYFDILKNKNFHYEMDMDDTTNAVCDAACTTARDIGAKAIIAVTKSGQTARRMSKFRPQVPIVAATPEDRTFHQLALSWGVYPVRALYQQTQNELFQHAIACARQIDVVEKGDVVVIVAGVPLDTSGNTNLLKVESV